MKRIISNILFFLVLITSFSLFTTGCNLVSTAPVSVNKPPSESPVQQQLTDGSRAFFRQDYAQAADNFKKAIDLDPEEPISRFAYGHALFAKGDYVASSQSLQKGLELYPNWVNSNTDLTTRFPENPERLTNNMAEILESIDIEPENIDLLFLYGYVLYFTDEQKEAHTYFDKVLALDSEHFAAQAFLN